MGTGIIFFSNIDKFKNGKFGTLSLKYRTNRKSFSNSGRLDISFKKPIINLPTPHIGFLPSIDSHSIPILIIRFSPFYFYKNQKLLLEPRATLLAYTST